MPWCKDIHTRDPGRPVKTATAALPLSMRRDIEMSRLDFKEHEILDILHIVLRTKEWNLTYEHQHGTGLGICKQLNAKNSPA